MTTRVYNLLFLCTGNSARSILAEAILNRQGAGQFQAFSAGSHPTGKVNRFALELLNKQGLDAAGPRSKCWSEFAVAGAPHLDFVITVCDNAAGEVCPIFPGRPMAAHWGIADPAAVEGSDDSKREAFFNAFTAIERRIARLLNLPFAKLDALALQREIDAIGRMQDGSDRA